MDALPPDPTAPNARFEPQRTTGRVEIAFRRHGTETKLARLFQDGAAKARLPRERERGMPDATLINLAGGLTGGDELRQSVAWEADAAAGVTTQAAEKIYRAQEGAVRVRTRLEAAPGAWAEWLPQETIVFEGARLDRGLAVDLAPEARLLAVESVVFGRLAMGERLRTSHVRDRIEVRVGGRLSWVDVNRLVPPVAESLDRPALGGGARALATMVYVGPDAAERLDAVRAIVDDAAVPAGASRLGPVIVARLHHPQPHVLRAAVATALARARAELGGWPARLPRLWHG